MKLDKKWLIAVAVIITAPIAAPIAVPTLIAHAGTEKVGAINTLKFTSRNVPASTYTSDWRRIGDMPAIQIVSKGPVSVTVSIDVEGGPVQLRTLVNGKVMRPGIAEFDGFGRDTSRSFTFVGRYGPTFDCRDVQVQWRPATSEKVVSARSAYSVEYRKPSKPLNYGCA